MLSVAVSAALHVMPLAFPSPQLARELRPLRAANVELEVVQEAALLPAPAPPAEPLASAPAPAPMARPRVAAARVAPSRPRASAPPEPAASATPEPAPDVPAPAEPRVAEPSVAEPGVAEPGANPSAAEPRATGQALLAPGGAGNGAGVGTAGGEPDARAGTGSAAAAGNAVAGVDLAALRGRYLGQLRARVLARREYPRLARRAGLEGTVCLRIAVDAAGRVAQVQPTCAAPEPLLEAALRAVREAAPFGPLPSGLGSELVVDLPMVFRLDAG